MHLQQQRLYPPKGLLWTDNDCQQVAALDKLQQQQQATLCSKTAATPQVPRASSKLRTEHLQVILPWQVRFITKHQLMCKTMSRKIIMPSSLSHDKALR